MKSLLRSCLSFLMLSPAWLHAVEIIAHRGAAGSRPENTMAAVTKAIEDYRFNEAANAAYDFVWGTFCDWYLELAKPILTGDDEGARIETRATAAYVLDQILKLLHPFMPFVTEELWAETGKIGPRRDKLLILTEWDQFKTLDFKAIYAGMKKPAFLFDGRNILDLGKLQAIGFRASGIGK